jgi:4-amino-4-deoxy-L-arabinose transferase-like glycosyltransferase
MNKNLFSVTALIFITLLVCFSLLEHGFWSIDEESYAHLTRTLVEDRQFHFETDYAQTYSPLHRAFFGIVSGDKIYSVFPPGYPILAMPFYYFLGLNGMQLANVFFTVLLILTFYFFIREFYSPNEAFIASIILLIGTQILNYSVSIWSHVPASFLILLSIYLIFKDRVWLGGALLGLGIVVRYSTIVIAPILFIYLYKVKKDKIPVFLISLLIGVSPLLIYNSVSFGSPFMSGMNVLNEEEGYNIFNIQNLPKALITNIVHYTFFPELEFFSEKGSLLETSPFLVFALYGAYLFWKEKKDKRIEFYTLSSSTILFILFISGTWSLGGLAHNMRLLTDIIPLIVFFAVIPIFQLKPNYKIFLTGSGLLAGIVYLYGLSYDFFKFINLEISIISLFAIFFIIGYKKDIFSGKWRSAFYFLLVISVGMSIFTTLFVTNEESTNRRNVRMAAEHFEKAIPEGSIVFIFFGDYPMYTEQRYLFLDYSQAEEEEIIQLLKYYDDRPQYVLFKEDKSVKKFDSYKLIQASPIRVFEILEEE